MFDHVVLTASHEGQARAYRAELRARGLDRRSTPRAAVVPDPGGRRVGSGIATLLALTEIAVALRERGKRGETLASLFAGERVCVIHCGGDSRRLPAYAAQGKIFAPLPVESDRPYPSALFDLLFDDLSRIALPGAGRVVVATGDVFLDIGAHELGFDRPGVVGVAWPDSPERGSRHGVYICDEAGSITGFLHKPTLEQAHAHGAIRPGGDVLIDTGVVCLDPGAVEHWLTRAGVSVDRLQAPGVGVGAGGSGALGRSAPAGPGLLRRAIDTGAPSIDLYGDILPAMAHDELLHGIDWRGGRGSIHAGGPAGSPLGFSAAIIPACPFLHIGSSHELLDVLTSGRSPAARWRWLPAGASGACIYNSRLDQEPATLGRRVVVESCHLSHAPSLPGSNILVGAPRELGTPVELPEGWGLVCLPVGGEHAPGQDRWVAMCFGEADDFKTPLTRAGSFGNRPLRHLLDRTRLSPAALWPGRGEADRTVWGAKLWIPTGVRTMLEPIGWMLAGECPSERWLAAPRLSAAEVMAAVDHARLLDARDRVLRGV